MMYELRCSGISGKLLCLPMFFAGFLALSNLCKYFSSDLQYNVKLFADDAFTQPGFTCSNLTKETLEQGVEYVQT